MSRNDPLQNPTGTGLSGDPLASPGQGTARVETRLTGGQGTTTGGAAATGGTQQGDEGVVDRAQDRAREVWDEARERTSELTDRAGEFASRAQHELGEAFDRAEDRLEQTGAISMIRDNPLIAAGLAFGLGFLLAGDGGRKRGGTMGRASGQLRSVVVGGVSTMLMKELQEMLDEHGGPAGLLSALTGRGSDEQPPREGR